MVSIEWFQRQAYVLHSSSCSGIGFGTLLHPHGVCHKCGCHKGPWSEPPRVRCSIWGTQWLPTGKAEQWSAVFPKWCILLFISVHASVHARSLQSCLTLCDRMDCSPSGFSVHGILQARVLEWAATPTSRGSSRPRDQTCIFYVSCIGRQVLHH